MLTSRAFGGSAKLLEALRTHDTRVVEQFAEPQAPSRARGVQGRSGEGAEETGSDPSDPGIRSSVPAQQLLSLFFMVLSPPDAGGLWSSRVCQTASVRSAHESYGNFHCQSVCPD